MTNLYDSEIKEILPEFLSKKPEVRAVSYAISKALQRLLDYSKGMEVYSGVDSLSAEVLDMMAIELDALYYDMSLPIEAKRRIIKETLPQYLTAGTVGAVENLITTIFGGGEIEEWYQYSGTRGHFRLYVDITESADNPVYQVDAAEMERKLKRVKKFSQHLDNFTWMYKRAIIIKEKSTEYVYTNPSCGSFDCGTYPRQSTPAWSVDEGIRINNEMDTSVYTNPTAGTFPEVSTIGWSEGTEIRAKNIIDALVYENESSGNADCGTMPETAAVGYSEDSTINLSRNGNKPIVAYVNNPPICGVLICGENL